MKHLVDQKKKCNKCEKSSPEVKFGVRASSKDGLNPTCTTCISAYQRERNAKLKAAKNPPIEINKKEGKVLQEHMNGDHKTVERSKPSPIPEKERVDEALLEMVRPFFYYLKNLKEDEEGNIKLPSSPSEFCQTFFPTAPFAGMQLFHTFVERKDEFFKFKAEITLAGLAKEYGTLITLSSLIRKPSPQLMAEDLAVIREDVRRLRVAFEKFIT